MMERFLSSKKCSEAGREVMISSIVMHGDELNGKGELVNSILKKSCESRNIAFVEHGGISVKDLNNSNLHLNTKGTKKLSHNFLEYLNKD